jgi:O-antigen/teichoic acid export membrane protein
MYAYASFVAILFTFGMETAFFRFFNKEREPHKVYATAMTTLLAASVLLSGAGIFLAGPLSSALKIPAHPEYVVWFALILGADALGAIPFARLRQQQKAAKFAVVRMANILINIGLNLFFLFLCPLLLRHLQPGGARRILRLVYDPAIGIGYVFIANLIASLATLLFLHREILGHSFRVDGPIFRRMLRYALPMVLVGLAGMVNETMDRILLEKWLPLPLSGRMVQIGIYSACYKLSLIMTLFIQAFRLAAEPFFFEQAKNSDARKTYARTMNYFVIVCSLIFLAVMVGIDGFKYFIGNRYHAGLGIVPVLLMANFCLGVYYTLSVWYKLTDKTLYGAAISVGGALLTLILNFWWIPVMGFRGSAWATFACYFAMMAAGFLLGQRHYFIPYDLKRFFFYPGLALGFFFLNSHVLQRLIHLPLAGRMASGSVWVLLFLIVVFYFERNRNHQAG